MLHKYATGEDISKSLCLSDWKTIAKEYGFVGDYFGYNMSHLDAPDSGIYFVVTLSEYDLDPFIKNKQTPPEIMKIDRTESKYIFPHRAAFKITDCESPVRMYHMFVNHLDMIEELRCCFNELSLEVPEKVLFTDAKGVFLLNGKRHNLDYPEAMRDNYNDAFKTYVKNLSKKKYDKIPKTIKDIDKAKHVKQRVPIKYFEEVGVDINFLTLGNDAFKFFEQEVKKFPEVRYYASKEVYVQDYTYNENVSKNKINFSNPLSRKDKYQQRKLGYMSFDSRAIAIILNRYNYREFESVSMEKLQRDATDGLHYVVVPDHYLNNYRSLLKANNVEYAFDEGKFTPVNCATMTIVYKYEDKDMVEAITRRLMREEREYHTTSLEQRQAAEIGLRNMPFSTQNTKPVPENYVEEYIKNFDIRKLLPPDHLRELGIEPLPEEDKEPKKKNILKR